jgi:uncharacterized protein YlaI
MEGIKFRERWPDRIKKLSEIDPLSQCWNWKGALKWKSILKQYGNMIIGSRKDKSRKSISAHRVSYLAFVGEIPENKWVLHKCDNPKCVNPDHLFLGERQENVDDRQKKGRNKPVDGTLNPNCKHSIDQIYEIRKLRAEGMTYRKIAKIFSYKSHKSIIEIVTHKKWSKPPDCKETQ